MFTLLTAGVLQTEAIIEVHQNRGNAITTLVDFLNPDVSTENVVMDLLASAGTEKTAVLHLTPPWPTEDLKAHSLTDSPLFRHASERIAALLQQMRRLSVYRDRENGWPLHVVGYEYGLAFVPMQDHLREEIRRMAALQAQFAREAAHYYIALPGGAYITVKQPAPPSATAIPEYALRDLEIEYGPDGKDPDKRVCDLIDLHRQLRDAIVQSCGLSRKYLG